MQVLDLSGSASLTGLGSTFSCLTRLTELNLSGPNLLFKDHTGSSTHPAADTAAASGGPLHAPAALATHPAPTPQDLPTLSHEQQRDLLPQLGALPNLRRLSLAHNRDMRMLPASLAGATQLRVLDVSSCSLRFLGEELWECVGLRELLLGDNVLAALGEDISRLQQLEVRLAPGGTWCEATHSMHRWTGSLLVGAACWLCCPGLPVQRTHCSPTHAPFPTHRHLLWTLPTGAGHRPLSLTVAAAGSAAVAAAAAPPGAGH